MKLVLTYKLIAAMLAVVIGMTTIGGGAVFAANDSLPGDTLYPIKLITEDARLTLSADPATQAELNLSFAAERAREMRQLAARGVSAPEEVIVRMAQHTERAMAQIANARPEEIPALLEQTMERTRAQQQVLEEVGVGAPKETQAALQHAMQVTQRAYQTASAAQGDSNRFRNEYERQYMGTPGPHGTALPSHTPVLPRATQTPHPGQNQKQHNTVTPTVTPQQNQNQGQANTEPHQGQNREQNNTVTPTSTPHQGQNREQNNTVTPTSTPQQNQEQDQKQGGDPNREQNREQSNTVTPTCTPQQDQDQDRDRTHTSQPTKTPVPTHTPKPSSTPKSDGEGKDGN